MKKKSLSNMNETELREYKVPFPKTEDELLDIIRQLVDRPHTYGTCVYAMSIAGLAAFRYVASKLGTTGFQSSCADLDFLRRNRSMNHGFRIINYNDLIYPQYCDSEYFPCYLELIRDNLSGLQELVKERMKESSDVHPEVLNHWKWILSLNKDRIEELIKKHGTGRIYEEQH